MSGGLFGEFSVGSNRIGTSVGAEAELRNLGQPKLMRTIKRTTFNNGVECDEVKYQMTMICPTTLRITKTELTKFLEGEVSTEIARIQADMVKLETVGRIYFVDDKCEGK